MPPPLVKVCSLPDSARAVFPFEYFNKMQSEAFKDIYESQLNCIVSAPTGSGKTVLFELAIISELNKLSDTCEFKALYIAPTKSLCNEKYEHWKRKFLNLSLGLLTSDTSLTEMDKVRSSNIIVSTPEKWDVMTRKWGDHKHLFRMLRLVLIDEIHILQEQRGSTLEVVLTRMNSLCQNLRILAVSATIPNILDIAEWLRSGGPTGPAAKVLTFDDSYRQVALERHVYTCNAKASNEFQLDAIFNTKLPSLIEEYGKGKPVLIFCSTRQSAVTTAKYLAHNFNSVLYPKRSKKLGILNDRQLNDTLIGGIAFHHAGMAISDRYSVEQKFSSGDIKILCSTSTLAVGVNLPAYLVIIKGTKMWSINGPQEYSNIDILQMIGRAGRPQFETTGCALILTDELSKGKYENLLQGTTTLESSLHMNLVEHIIAEITLKTILSSEMALKWLKNTFFYVRYTRKPSSYRSISDNIVGETVKEQLSSFCEKTLKDLIDHEIIISDQGTLRASAFGEALTRHYILSRTLKGILRKPPGLKVHEILQLLSTSGEFDDIRLKHTEKRLYREINNNPLLRFSFVDQKKQPISVTTREQKISLLIQYELGGLEFPIYPGSTKHHQTLVQDKFLIFRNCPRLLKCMIDCFIEKKDGNSLKSALFLYRSINGRGWEDTPMILRQISSIGLVSVRKLVSHGIVSFEDLKNLSNQQIEYYLSLKPGNGLKIKKNLERLPEFTIRYVIEKQVEYNNIISLNFKIEVQAVCCTTKWHDQFLSVLLIVKRDDGKLLDFRRNSIQKLSNPKSFRICIQVDKKTSYIDFLLSCEQIAGVVKNIRHPLKPSDVSRHAVAFKQSTTSRNILNDEFEKAPLDSNFTYIDGANDSEDDELLALLRDKGPSVSGMNLQQKRTLLPNGNYKCNHHCKDKTVCRHLCCREGIPKPQYKTSGFEKTEIRNEEPIRQNINHRSKDFGFEKEITEEAKNKEQKLPSLPYMLPHLIAENPALQESIENNSLTLSSSSSTIESEDPETEKTHNLTFLGSDIIIE